MRGRLHADVVWKRGKLWRTHKVMPVLVQGRFQRFTRQRFILFERLPVKGTLVEFISLLFYLHILTIFVFFLHLTTASKIYIYIKI